MSRLLVILIIVVSVVEFWGIIQMGRWIGGWLTFGLILLMGFLGAYFAKKEVTKVLNSAGQQLSRGEMPGMAILDCLCIFAGGVLLLLPGFFTDIIGLLILIPWTRPFFRTTLFAFVSNKLLNGKNTYFIRR